MKKTMKHKNPNKHEATTTNQRETQNSTITIKKKHNTI